MPKMHDIFVCSQHTEAKGVSMSQG